jgi:IS5 family transposase
MWPMRQFAGLYLAKCNFLDQATIFNFRNFFERHFLSTRLLTEINMLFSKSSLLLKQSTIVDAAIIAAPSSTKNKSGKRDLEMRQTQKGDNWHFGMKAHISVDAEPGLTRTVTTAPANDYYITQAHALAQGEEEAVFGDSGVYWC